MPVLLAVGVAHVGSVLEFLVVVVLARGLLMLRVVMEPVVVLLLVVCLRVCYLVAYFPSGSTAAHIHPPRPRRRWPVTCRSPNRRIHLPFRQPPISPPHGRVGSTRRSHQRRPAGGAPIGHDAMGSVQRPGRGYYTPAAMPQLRAHGQPLTADPDLKPWRHGVHRVPEVGLARVREHLGGTRAGRR